MQRLNASDHNKRIIYLLLNNMLSLHGNVYTSGNTAGPAVLKQVVRSGNLAKDEKARIVKAGGASSVSIIHCVVDEFRSAKLQIEIGNSFGESDVCVGVRRRPHKRCIGAHKPFHCGGKVCTRSRQAGSKTIEIVLRHGSAHGT